MPCNRPFFSDCRIWGSYAFDPTTPYRVADRFGVGAYATPIVSRQSRFGILRLHRYWNTLYLKKQLHWYIDHGYAGLKCLRFEPCGDNTQSTVVIQFHWLNRATQDQLIKIEWMDDLAVNHFYKWYDINVCGPKDCLVEVRDEPQAHMIRSSSTTILGGRASDIFKEMSESHYIINGFRGHFDRNCINNSRVMRPSRTTLHLGAHGMLWTTVFFSQTNGDNGSPKPVNSNNCGNTSYKFATRSSNSPP
jgi:hypothetical protein